MKLMGLRPSSQQIKFWLAMCVAGLFLPLLSEWISELLVYQTSLKQLMWLPLCIGLFAIIIDGAFNRKPPSLRVSRSLAQSLSVHKSQSISLKLENLGPRSMELECADMVPSAWKTDHTFPKLRLASGESATLSYQATPQRRGQSEFNSVQVRLVSRLKLWQISWDLPCVSTHKVYPEFTAISDLSGLNGSINLRESGLKTYNKRGTGMDFMHLRDYREGDSLRQVNWRATSRFRKLISSDYQEEKNQNVIVMLDAGRRMCIQDDDKTYFDYALNAIIMLAYTALKNGDNVSVQSFGNDSRWLSNVKGAKNVAQVLNHFYDLYPQKVASDYLGASQALIAKQPKRALVLLITCLRDEDCDDILSATRLLKNKHLVAVISIAEPVYKQISNKPIDSFDDALNYTASLKLETSISNNQKRLQNAGIACIHMPAEQLTPSALNMYLSVKKSGVL